MDIAFGPAGQPLSNRCAPRSFNGSEVICDYSAGSGTDYTFAVAVGGQWSQYRGADRFDYPVPPVVYSVQGCPTNRGESCACRDNRPSVDAAGNYTYDCPTDGRLLTQPVLLTITGRRLLPDEVVGLCIVCAR